MHEYMKPLDDLINKKFIPSLLESIITEEDRKLYSLPIRFGGLGIPIISEISQEGYNASKKITAPLVSLMIMQENSLPDEKSITELKVEVKKQQENLLSEKVKETENNFNLIRYEQCSKLRKKVRPVGWVFFP